MRQRKANQTALTKTLEFLTEVKRIANTGEIKTLSQLYKQFNVSKATGAACKKLDLFYYHETGAIVWMGGEVKKETALSVLEVLRLRNDKMVAMPLEGFESLVDTLQQLVTALKPKSDAARQVGNYKQGYQSDLLKIACAISTGVYTHLVNTDDESLERGLSRSYEEMNDNIITASKDLLTKIYK